MKVLCIVFALMSHFMFAQNPVFHKDSTNIKPIQLPETKGARLYFGYRSNPVYIDNQKDYYALFDEKQHKNLPVINFEKEYLQGVSYCVYCSKTGRDNGLRLIDSVWYDYEPRHRNACGYALNWQTVSKTKSSVVPFRILALAQTKVNWGKTLLVLDSQEAYQALKAKNPEVASVLDEVDFSKYVVLAHALESDCAARFEYNVSHDPLHKKYILEIYHISRGCMTTQKYEYWVKVPKAPLGYTYEEKIIPVKHR